MQSRRDFERILLLNCLLVLGKWISCLLLNSFILSSSTHVHILWEWLLCSLSSRILFTKSLLSWEWIMICRLFDRILGLKHLIYLLLSRNIFLLILIWLEPALSFSFRWQSFTFFNTFYNIFVIFKHIRFSGSIRLIIWLVCDLKKIYSERTIIDKY